MIVRQASGCGPLFFHVAAALTWYLHLELREIILEISTNPATTEIPHCKAQGERGERFEG